MSSSYIKHGYLATVYGHWVHYEGTEWGDQMRALHAAYEMGQDDAGFTDEQMDDIESILRTTLDAAAEDGWLLTGADTGDGDFYKQEAQKALANYTEAREYWEAKSIKDLEDLEAFEAADKLIPAWMKSADVH